ncbi:hypothetical protein RHMOL_Rhmol12G0005100 [Rhododendron molle]|uniref:Uncharacterized protein n=1 Tax=Rhododendron molle TaxID=49168 RepID=A0ACC0LDV9_RHOML|nr:hypothetical protein RHMOL_Rhmol12G0005100 [Rhododendron molle]
MCSRGAGGSRTTMRRISSVGGGRLRRISLDGLHLRRHTPVPHRDLEQNTVASLQLRHTPGIPSSLCDTFICSKSRHMNIEDEKSSGMSVGVGIVVRIMKILFALAEALIWG